MSSLWQTSRSAFDIGASVGGLLPDDYSAVKLELLRTQFSIITPENCMKARAIQPEEGTFDFRQADALLAFAHANGKRVTGHTLLWPQVTPEWMFRDGKQPAGRDLLLSRLRTHIHTLVGRYRGQIIGWDVVNEAIDNEDDYLRVTPWLQQVGDDYLLQAYRFAHEADPEMQLFYNDYDIEPPVKREKTLRLISELQDAGIPLAAVGIQGHWILDEVPFADLDIAIAQFARAGVKVTITELDLSMLPGTNLPAILTGRAAGRTARTPGGAVCRVVPHLSTSSQVITRVAFWNPHDGRSWLNGFPYQRTNYPLLFIGNVNANRRIRRCWMSRPHYEEIGATVALAGNT